MTGKFLRALGVSLVGVAGVGAVLASCARADSSGRAGAKAEFTERCANLQGQRIGGAVIDKTKFVARNSMLLPVPLLNSPQFCRVMATIAAAPGSQIQVQVWLPSDWNGKFVGFGGGGFEGMYSAANIMLRRPVGAGYAAVVTDAGHKAGGEPKWALGHPQKIIDYGYRANHLAAVMTRSLVTQFYGAAPKRAYFWGCSNGGRDALMLAQRYPKDYDAIAAGAAAYSFTARMAGFSQMGADFSKPAGQSLVPKLKLLNEAAIAHCDGRDGVKDGVIERPDQCAFDPASLQCKPGAAEDCLSKDEVELARSLYRGVVDRDGSVIVPGFAIGSEHTWTPPKPKENMGTSLYRYMVYDDANWSPDTFVLDRDLAAARKKVGAVLDATDPNLRPFFERGGKLLMYHGWDDAAIPPGSSLSYHDAVRATVGPGHAQNLRLFMLPGVEHCGEGKGPDQFDYFAELDRWTRTGQAPEQITMTKYDNKIAFWSGLPTKALRTRPACAWPKTAKYKGAGSTDDAANFECR
jgi:pimeloyl-ACP methyl ester carboxylesterase